ncbi:MAG: carboxymuconolactone decarboxylase family protein [Rhodospirillaceae bacterium]|nr:carboxymuconolactone decarboxylase family protein [Rhodospirillaceae bacterium]
MAEKPAEAGHDDDAIDPRSGCRLPPPRREDLSGATLAMYDDLAGGGGKTLLGLRGPAGLFLHSPEVAVHCSALNTYLRWGAGFSGRVREIVILVTARECDSQFEWAAHERQALKEGVEPAIVEIIKHRRDTAGLAEDDALLIDFGRELLRQKKLSRAIYDRALKRFGSRGLVDLVSLIGNYASTALLLAAFNMQLPAGQAPLLPEA